MDRDREKEQLLKRLSMCETEEDSERQKERERVGREVGEVEKRTL